MSEPPVIVQTDHPLVNNGRIRTAEEFVLGLIHRKAYEEVRGLAKGRSVLDWGCNDGYGLEILLPHASRIAGLDTGTLCVDAAQRRLPRVAGRIRKYDGERFPFGAETFDLIISFQVIEHVIDLDAFLRSVRLPLARQGAAVFTTPNRLIRLDPGMKPWNPFHATEFSALDLHRELRRHFAEVTILGLHGKPHLVSLEKRRCELARSVARHTDRGDAGELQVAPAPRQSSTALLRRRIGRMRLGRLLWQLRYRTRDLHYSSECVDEAVDLMAICKAG